MQFIVEMKVTRLNEESDDRYNRTFTLAEFALEASPSRAMNVFQEALAQMAAPEHFTLPPEPSA